MLWVGGTLKFPNSLLLKVADSVLPSIQYALQMWPFSFLSSFINGNLRKLVVIVVFSQKLSQIGPPNFIAFVVQKLSKINSNNSTTFQFVIFKPLSYYFFEIIGFDVKVSSSSVASSQTKGYNKKKFKTLHGLKITNWLSVLKILHNICWTYCQFEKPVAFQWLFIKP